MREWLKKYWPFLALLVGGVIVLVYIRKRQADTTGTNQLAATVPVWGSGSGGTFFEPIQSPLDPTSFEPIPPTVPPISPAMQPGPEIQWIPTVSIQAPAGPIGSNISGIPPGFFELPEYVPPAPSIMAVQVQSGYEVG